MKHNFEDESRLNDQIIRDKDILETKFRASELLAARLAILLANPSAE